MKKNVCKYCGGKFKISTTEYTIRSRHSSKAETTIENLAVNECTICGHIEMPETSELYIEMIRKKIREEMNEKTNSYKGIESIEETDIEKEKVASDFNLSSIKNMFKKFIG